MSIYRYPIQLNSRLFGEGGELLSARAATMTAAAPVRLKDGQRLGELEAREIEVEVRPAPGSAWPSGGVDIWRLNAHGTTTKKHALPRSESPSGPLKGRGDGRVGGSAHSRGHSRGGSLGSLTGLAAGDAEDWMESLAGIVVVKLRKLPEGTPAMEDLTLDDATTVAALKLKIMDKIQASSVVGLSRASSRPSSPAPGTPAMPPQRPARGPGGPPNVANGVSSHAASASHHPPGTRSPGGGGDGSGNGMTRVGSTPRLVLGGGGGGGHGGDAGIGLDWMSPKKTLNQSHVDPNPLVGAVPPVGHGDPIRTHASNPRGGGGGSSGSLTGLFSDLTEFANGVADAANSELRVLDSFGKELSGAATALTEALPELERAAGGMADAVVGTVAPVDRRAHPQQQQHTRVQPQGRGPGPAPPFQQRRQWDQQRPVAEAPRVHRTDQGREVRETDRKAGTRSGGVDVPELTLRDMMGDMVADFPEDAEEAAAPRSDRQISSPATHPHPSRRSFDADWDSWELVHGNPKPSPSARPREQRAVDDALDRALRKVQAVREDGDAAAEDDAAGIGAEGAEPASKPTLLGGVVAESAVAVLPPAAAAPARRFLAASHAALAAYAPTVAGWPPVAHLAMFVTVAALLVQAMGFALWCTLAVAVMYLRCVDAEERRCEAERAAAEHRRDAAKARDEADRASFALAAAAARAAAAAAMEKTGAEGAGVGRCIGLGGGGEGDPHAQFVLGGVVSGGDAAWLNTSLAAAWAGFLRGWLSRLVHGTLSEALVANTPSILETMTLERFDLSDAPPGLASARVLRSRRRADGSVMLELGVAADELGSSLVVAGKVAGLGIPLHISVDFTAARIDLRLGLTFIDRPPYVGSLKVSLVDMPKTSLRISPEGLGGLSLTDLPGVDAWLRGAVEGALVRTLVEPNAYLWDVAQWWDAGKERQVAEEKARVDAAFEAGRAGGRIQVT